MTAEKVGLRLRRLFWLLATACITQIPARHAQTRRPQVRGGYINQCPYVVRKLSWQDVPVTLTVKHHTAGFMLQHGVSAERIGLLAPLRLRRRNMGHGPIPLESRASIRSVRQG